MLRLEKILRDLLIAVATALSLMYILASAKPDIHLRRLIPPDISNVSQRVHALSEFTERPVQKIYDVPERFMGALEDAAELLDGKMH